MEKEHKSIFTRIKEYKGNPIDEYNKISNILSQKCYGLHSIFGIFEDCFKYSKLLSVNFVNLRDCIRPYCALLDTYCQSNYSYLDDKIKDDLLDSFLTYCEIVLCMFYVSIYWYIKTNGLFDSIYFDKGIFNQFLSIIV